MPGTQISCMIFKSLHRSRDTWCDLGLLYFFELGMPNDGCMQTAFDLIAGALDPVIAASS